MVNTDLLVKRAAAVIIDSIILGAIYIIGMVLAGGIGLTIASAAGDIGGAIAFMTVVAVLGILFVLSLLYYIVLEGPVGRGQTFGKKIMKIWVRSEDGSIPSYTQTALRTVLRIVDGMFCYLVGAAVIYTTEKGQRIGDIAAKTIVEEAY